MKVRQQMQVKVLVDSGCDLTEQYYNEYDIEMIPLTVHLDGKDYKDNIEIAPKTIYDAMRAEKEPKTSQISPQTFKTIFTSYVKKNQPFIYLAFSSGLSGTYQTTRMLVQEIMGDYPDAPCQLIDTKCASIVLWFVVLRAANMALDGASLESILSTATYHAENMEQIFTFDDLDDLKRGGRV